MTGAGRVGLCLTCSWARVVTNRRGSTFYRCARAESDSRYPRYPPLPRLSCDGYEAGGDASSLPDRSAPTG
jgi:hypothetical protein